VLTILTSSNHMLSLGANKVHIDEIENKMSKIIKNIKTNSKLQNFEKKNI